MVHGEEEDGSAGILIIPKFPEGTDNDKQGPSSSKKDKSEGGDGQGGSRQTEEPMQQDASQAGGEDDRASTGGASSLDFNIFSDLENNADTLETTEPADEGISTLEPPSAFMEMKRNLPESSSPGNSRNNDQRILMESRLWRSGLCEDPRETTQAIDGIVWERRDENKNRNRTDSRLPWRNRGESSDCTRILQHVWFSRVTIESRTET